MTVTEMVLGFAVGGGGSATVAYGGAWLMGQKRKLAAKKKVKAVDASKVDGRTHEEWYAIIKDIGKEEYERLARPALDGLEEKAEYGWDVKRLLGEHLHTSLMRQWYPEKYPIFCVYCGRSTCKKDCDVYWAGKPLKKAHPRHCLCNDCADIILGSKISTGRGYTPGRPGPRPQNKKPGTRMNIWDAGPTFRKHKITIMDVGYGSSKLAYRIARDHENWLADQDEIAAFQIHKGLQPTGTINHQTKDVLIRYLDAGNPWPIEMPIIKKPTTFENEMARIDRELKKWDGHFCSD